MAAHPPGYQPDPIDNFLAGQADAASADQGPPAPTSADQGPPAPTQTTASPSTQPSTTAPSSTGGASSTAPARQPGTPPPNNDPGPVDLDFGRSTSFAGRNRFVGPEAGAPVRLSTTDIAGIEKQLLKAPYKPDHTKGVHNYLARVLRVENRNTSEDGESAMFGWFDSLVGKEDSTDKKMANIECVAIIDCDIHAPAWGETGVGNPNFKLPNEFGQGGSNVLINKIRDNYHAHFTAKGWQRTPIPGEWVWVTWADLKNRRDGIFIEPVNPNPPAGQFGQDPCDRLTSNSPNGGSPWAANAGGIPNNWGAPLRKKINAKIERGQHPIGKGIFTGYPDITKHKVKVAKEATLNWVCYTGLKQKDDGSAETALDITKARKFADAYHKEQIRTYVMGYPRHSHEEKFITDLINIATKTEAIGIIINMDNYYSDEGSISEPYDREIYLIKNLHEQAKKAGFSIGLTATNIINRKKVPWKLFTGLAKDSKESVDFCVPQVLLQAYDSKREAVLSKEETKAAAAAAGSKEGDTGGFGTTFDDITPQNFKTVLQSATVTEEFKQKWLGRGLNKRGGDFDQRTVFMMAALEAIEEYWKQMYNDAKVIVTDHWRDASGNHSTGGAIDHRIEYGAKKRVPVLQTWGALKKLINAGRIPNGGAGCYLNVSADGLKGPEPDKAGKATGGTGIHGGPGGSASPHYDMRGFLYSGKGKAKNTIWVDLDKNGDGKDDIASDYSTAISYLKSNNLASVANYVRKDNGTWISDKHTPQVTSNVRNMKQILGLESTGPMLPSSAAELSFIKQFEAWKNIGFKNITPGLGMIGKSPAPNGWKPDGYNTVEKSPWRMRQDATWTYTSTRQIIHTVMADAIIWWDWAGANVSHSDWPEKRWDIIRELGNANAAAAKLKEIKNSSISEKEKEKITNYQLSDFLRHSPTPAEETAASRDSQETEPPVKPPEPKVPTTTTETEDPQASGLSAAQKKEIQNNIDEKTKALKENEKQLEELKAALKGAETSGSEEDKQKAISAIKGKQEEVAKQNKEIKDLQTKLGKEKIAATDTSAESGGTEASSPPPAANPNTSTRPCADSQGGSGQQGRTASTGLPIGVVKESKLPGVDFVDFGFQTYARKSTNFIIIHNPAGTSGNHQKVAKTLLAKNYGVHFTVEPSGKQRQHVELELGCSHAIPENYSSIGIEAVVRSMHITPDSRFNPGPRGFYESVFNLCAKIVKATSIPMTIPHANLTKGEFFFGNNGAAWGGSPNLKPGIIAHGAWHRNRSDGRMETLYIALRLNGNTPSNAYKMARKAHDDQKVKTKKEGKYSWARVIGLKKGEANTPVDWAAPLTKKGAGLLAASTGALAAQQLALAEHLKKANESK